MQGANGVGSHRQSNDSLGDSGVIQCLKDDGLSEQCLIFGGITTASVFINSI